MRQNVRAFGLVILSLALVVGIFAGIRIWRIRDKASQEQMAMVRAESLLKRGRPDEALTLADAFTQNNKTNQAWGRIKISALAAQQNIPRLALLLKELPVQVLADEKASVLLAHALLHARKAEDYLRVRHAWRGHELHHDSWLALDADALVLAGKPKEAENLLRSESLPGVEDATRLIRLSLLTANHDLPTAWKLLRKATELDPHNPDTRSFRAQMLEASGRPEMARVEYVAALLAEPKNPLLRNQLADFYVRNNSPDLALDTWTQTLNTNAPDFIWLKVAFWGRVLRPLNLASCGNPPAGDLKPTVNLVSNLKPGEFFNATSYEKMSSQEKNAAQRPELYWLRLLETLRSKHETEALSLIQSDAERFGNLDPELLTAIHRILYYRQKNSLNPSGVAIANPTPHPNLHEFFVSIDNTARRESSMPGHPPELSPELAKLLKGPDAFLAAFLAIGWREAALQLRPSAQGLAGTPEWLQTAFAQALRINRTPAEALVFLGEEPLRPMPALLRAELQVELGRRDEARISLKKLATLDSGVGFRAAYLLALDAAENGQTKEARFYIAQQPQLGTNIIGQELFARLALVDGDRPAAELIYHRIQRNSIEAKEWFAREAYSQRNWAEARQFTREMLDEMPDSSQLRENLLAIDKAEASR